MTKSTPEMPKGGGSFIRGADGKLTRAGEVPASAAAATSNDAAPAAKPAKGAK